MDERLQYLFNKLKTKCPTIFIAGGAAVDFDKAGDVDIWFGLNNKSLAEQYLDSLAWHRLCSKKEKEAYGSGGFNIVGMGYDPVVRKLIQVLIVPDRTASECMMRFDISTHRWAYESTGAQIRGTGATTPEQEPTIILFNSVQTNSRYIKICLRYGHDPDLSELEK